MWYKQAWQRKKNPHCTDWPLWNSDWLRATVNNAQKCNLIIAQFLTFYQSHTESFDVGSSEAAAAPLCPLLLEEDHY